MSKLKSRLDNATINYQQKPQDQYMSIAGANNFKGKFEIRPQTKYFWTKWDGSLDFAIDLRQTVKTVGSQK